MVDQANCFKWFVVVLIGAVFILTGCQNPGDLAVQAAQQGPGGAVGTGDIAVDFVVPTLDGNSVQLSDLRGRPVILYFWATWCGSCTFDMPIMETFYQQETGSGLVVLAVNVGQSEITVRDFIAEGGYTFPVGLDGNMDVGRTYRLLGFPSTYFIDSDGVIRNVHMGQVSQETLEERLAMIR